MDNEQLLIKKLDRFIRKYYINRIIRGVLLTVGFLGGCYLLFVILENLFRFDSVVRMVLFYLFIAVAAISSFAWILKPIGSILRFGKRISQEQAAGIIGQHFSEINDKLLNSLQLIRQKKENKEELELLIASIEQRIQKMKLFQFTLVINYKRNLRYLKVTIPPVAIIIMAWVIAPAFITEPTSRIVNYSKGYEIPLPFEVTILNDRLEAYQQDDFELMVRVTGEEIPSEVHIETEGYTYRMRQNSAGNFSFLFRSLQKEISFRIVAKRYRSDEYRIKVFLRPTIFSFTVNLEFPAYTGRKSEILENTGDIVAPEGTMIQWIWNTRDVTSLFLRLPDRDTKMKSNGSNLFSYRYRCASTGNYSFLPENESSKNNDSLSYRIICIEDGYPSILTEIQQDSLLPSRIFFRGSVKDDYGFTGLEFNYKISEAEDTIHRKDEKVLLPISKEVREELFYYSIDMEKFLLEPGERMTYFFEVWDNDGIRGPKSARSEIREIRALTMDEIRAHAEENEQMVREKLSKSRQDAEDVEKAIEQMNRKLLEKQTLDWQEKKDIEELIRRNEEMLQTIDKIKEGNRKAIQSEEQFLQTSQAIMEKQKRLQELMGDMMTEEMKKTLEELKELMKQVDKEKLKTLMEEMKMTAKELEQQLDRNLELFKQIEFERKLEENIRQLRETAEKQSELADQLKQQKEIREEDKSGQKQVNARYDSIQKELKKLEKLDQELESPLGLEKTKEKQDSISESLKEVVEKMEKQNEKEAEKNQRDAGEQMDRLADDLEQMQAEAEEDQYAEDAHQIRQILEHLLTVSFDQEELLNRTRTINRNDPGFQQIITRQKQVMENLEPVKDTLEAIGKRQFVIQPIIARELLSLKRNIEKTVQNLTERNMPEALAGQQFSMTALNNLAVLLDEAMEQMNHEMHMSMKGKGGKMCKNPSMGKGNKNMKKISQMQQQLTEQMERIRKGLQEQMNKQGEKGKAGTQGMNEQIARLAAEQEAVREELQKYAQYLKEQGEMDQGSLNEAIKEMEQNERDLINKQVTRESLLRQQKILTRLLESERAEQIREHQEERESNEAKNQKYSNPGQNLEYNKYSYGGTELLRRKTLPVNRFYKGKTNKYLIKIEK